MSKELKDKIYIIANKLIHAMRVSMVENDDLGESEDSVWRKIQAKIAIKPVSRYLYNAWRIGAVAASVLCVSLIGVMLFSGNKPIDPELILLTNLSDKNKQYVLPDSSTVLLRPNSQITYVDVGLPIRDIALNGEGFFEIRSNPADPFTIQTDAGVVRVLGTKFSLKADAASLTSELILTEGAVEFLSGDSSFAVKPNQKMTVDKNSGDIHIKTVNPDFELAWKADYLQFTNQPLIEVLEKLADIYQVQIEISDTVLANTRFTGRLNNDYGIDKILNDLSLITKIKYEVKGGVYVIKTNQN